jgi:hypothetical protein
MGGAAVGMNPFASGKQLVDLDALSSTSSQQQQPKNPFSATNSGKYQWETPKPAQPSLAQLQQSPQFNTMSPQMTGNSAFGTTASTQFGALSSQMTGASTQSNGFGAPMQNPFGAQPMMPANGNPFGQQGFQNQTQMNPFGQSQTQFNQSQTNNSSFF